MAFDFEKYKRRLELDGWKFQKKATGRRTDWAAKKKSFLTSKARYFSVFIEAPKDNELLNFIESVKKLESKEDLEEALLIAPKCDRFALSKFIEKKEGRFSKGSLKKIISFRACDSQIKIPKDMRKKIVEEEMKKPTVVKKMVKATDEYKIFRRICSFARKFELTPYMIKKEMDVEQNFFTYLKAKFGKREEIIYEKAKSTGRFDIFFPKRKIAIEFKLLNKRSDLHSVVGQVFNYQDDYNYMMVVLVNVKRWPKSEIINAEKRMKSLENVEVITK